MISAIAFKENSVLTVYLKDRLIKGCSLGTVWGKVRLVNNKIMSYDGYEYYENESEEVDISDVIAIGNSENQSHIAKNALCMDLCDLERNLSVEKARD